MLNKLQNVPVTKGRRTPVIFGLLVCMLVSLFFSRALLSISMMTFVAVSFFHPAVKEQFRQFFTSPLLWGMSLLFFVPLLSGLWSNNQQAWLETLQVKLPLLFLPLAFAAPFNFSAKQGEGLAYVFIGTVTVATIWSLFHYAANPTAVNEGYLKAKMLLTPLENDHVRFSWMVSVAILTAMAMLYAKRSSRIVLLLLSFVLLWLIVFLHLLAARTGLFSFYIILLVVSGWLIYKKMKWRYGISLLALLIALPFLAYQFMPTFKNRVKYFNYDLGYLKKTNYLPGANDAVRVISLKAGYGIIKEYPAKGVGFGDVFTETKKWYNIHYPQMVEQDRIYPSSEWLIYGAACGIGGLLVFSVIMIIPFFVRTHTGLAWVILNLIAAAGFLFDIGLEVQFGVFIYSFVILCWWKYPGSVPLPAPAGPA
ncbi:MAG: O-antigen ligase family protein [Chitinophagaceae bacterium]